MELAIGEVNSGGRRLFTGFIRDVTERQTTLARLKPPPYPVVRPELRGAWRRRKLCTGVARGL